MKHARIKPFFSTLLLVLFGAVALCAVAVLSGCTKTIHLENQSGEDAQRGAVIY